MLLFNLKKSYEISDRNPDLAYFYNDKWLCNGHFIVRRENVKNCNRYILQTDREQPDIERVIPDTELETISYSKTQWLYDNTNGLIMRKFESADGKILYIQEDYVKTFSVDVALSILEPFAPVSVYNGAVYIMQCRGPEQQAA